MLLEDTLGAGRLISQQERAEVRAIHQSLSRSLCGLSCESLTDTTDDSPRPCLAPRRMRRSGRLAARAAGASTLPAPPAKRCKTTTTLVKSDSLPKTTRSSKAKPDKLKQPHGNQKKKKIPPTAVQGEDSLPRTREQYLLGAGSKAVIGIDEAGRGPLAGPVVAAACAVEPWAQFDGINDSKQVKEDSREAVFEKLTASGSGVRWAVATVDARRIDEINILQATMEAMQLATRAALGEEVSSKGAEVQSGGKSLTADASQCHALVDGNRVPKEMPCEAEYMIKGDGKEFVIAAASIIAKVTRDRIMHAHHETWPQYNFAKHKGYPTSEHMAAVSKYGATPQHRLTFAPLKHMSDKQLKYKPA